MIKVGLTQRVEFLADRNERRDCLDQAWARLLIPAGMIPVPLCNDVDDVPAYVGELGLDGVILTGGNDLSDQPGAVNTAPERDAFERSLLAMCRDLDVPAFGVCRGMHMMVVEAGGSLVRIEKHVARPHAIAVRGESSMPISDRDAVNSYHNFGVRAEDLSDDWRPTAFAADGTVEAMAHTRCRQWAVMWHPERSPCDARDIELMKQLFGERAS